MTSKEILQKAINKAVKSGYINTYRFDASVYMPYKRYLTLIFDHRFAKAFWGEGESFDSKVFPWKFDDMAVKKPRWQYYLQQMVLEEDPLKYLEKFL